MTTTTALLVIDVQQGLCEAEDSSAFPWRPLVARINTISARARAAGWPVVFVQHESDDAGSLAFDSAAWQLADGLQVQRGDLRVRKTAADSFHRTDLAQQLQRHGVTDLMICGMHTEFCIDTTTRRALALGYPVVLVADAHLTADKAHLSAAQIIRHHNATLSDIESFGPQVRAIETAALDFSAAAAIAVAAAPKKP